MNGNYKELMFMTLAHLMIYRYGRRGSLYKLRKLNEDLKNLEMPNEYPTFYKKLKFLEDTLQFVNNLKKSTDLDVTLSTFFNSAIDYIDSVGNLFIPLRVQFPEIVFLSTTDRLDKVFMDKFDLINRYYRELHSAMILKGPKMISSVLTHEYKLSYRTESMKMYTEAVYLRSMYFLDKDKRLSKEIELLLGYLMPDKIDTTIRSVGLVTPVIVLLAYYFISTLVWYFNGLIPSEAIIFIRKNKEMLSRNINNLALFLLNNKAEFIFSSF